MEQNINNPVIMEGSDSTVVDAGSSTWWLFEKIKSFIQSLNLATKTDVPSGMAKQGSDSTISLTSVDAKVGKSSDYSSAITLFGKIANVISHLDDYIAKNYAVDAVLNKLHSAENNRATSIHVNGVGQGYQYDYAGDVFFRGSPYQRWYCPHNASYSLFYTSGFSVSEESVLYRMVNESLTEVTGSSITSFDRDFVAFKSDIPTVSQVQDGLAKKLYVDAIARGFFAKIEDNDPNTYCNRIIVCYYSKYHYYDYAGLIVAGYDSNNKPIKSVQWFHAPSGDTSTEVQNFDNILYSTVYAQRGEASSSNPTEDLTALYIDPERTKLATYGDSNTPIKINSRENVYLATKGDVVRTTNEIKNRLGDVAAINVWYEDDYVPFYYRGEIPVGSSSKVYEWYDPNDKQYRYTNYRNPSVGDSILDSDAGYQETQDKVYSVVYESVDFEARNMLNTALSDLEKIKSALNIKN